MRRRLGTHLAVKRRVGDGSHGAAHGQAGGGTAPGDTTQELTRSQHVGGCDPLPEGSCEGCIPKDVSGEKEWSRKRRLSARH